VDRAVCLEPSQQLWLLGADSELPRARGTEVLEGRFPIQAADPEAPPEVAVEARLAALLAPGGTPVGMGFRRRRVGTEIVLEVVSGPRGRDWVVVGVVEDESAGSVDRFGYEKGRPFRDEMNELMRLLGVAPARVPWIEDGLGIYLPRAEVAGDHLDWIFIRVHPEQVSAIANRVESALVERGRVPLVYTNAVWSILTRPELESYTRLHQVFFAISVAVGLAILANLLLLTGWQRRGEIALRRAEGALRADIFFQFMLEGLLIALTGLIVGFPVGMLIAKLRVSLDPNVAINLQWPWVEGLRAGLILSAGALLTACYPAYRASGHDPMNLFRQRGAS
jgi:putative ABC transport system permease protein